MEWVTLVTIIISLIYVEVFAVDIPAYKLNFATLTTKAYFKENIIGRAVPDYTVSPSRYFKNLKISEVDIPYFSLNVSGEELLVIAKGMVIRVDGSFEVTIVFSSIVSRELEKITASIEKVDVILPVSLKKDSYLQADGRGCRVSSGDISYTFKEDYILGGLDRFLMKFHLKRQVEEKVCDAITKAINNNSVKLKSILN